MSECLTREHSLFQNMAVLRGHREESERITSQRYTILYSLLYLPSAV